MPIGGILPAFIGDWGDQGFYVPPKSPLVDPGSFIISSDVGSLPEGYDASRVQKLTLGMVTTGFGHQIAYDYRLADDFEIPEGEVWQIESITFHLHQSFTSTHPTINDVRIWIYDDDPEIGNLIWGDAVTNRFEISTFSGIFRVSDQFLPLRLDRPIQAVRCSVDAELAAGVYWVAWSSGGDGRFSGPWATPLVIEGQTVTGNARQYTNDVWGNAGDSGTGAQQGFPLLIEGTKTSEGGGGPGGTTIIDSFIAALEADASVMLEDDELVITVEPEYTGTEDDTNYDGEVSGDIDVDLECQ